jgi:lipid-A-disaccharide synthase-like uncharacterized protein
MSPYQLIGALGLICIIAGTLMVSSKKSIRRRYVYPLLIVGGILLEVYSIYIQDTIFIILQSVFILTSIYGLIKINERGRK